MKKVAIFCGREHHWKRLSGISNLLAERGNEPFYYISDNAWNIDPSSAYLISRGQVFKHSLDYFDPAFMPHINAIVASGLGDLVQCSFDQDIFSFVDLHLVAFSIREFSEFIMSTAKMLTVEKPDVVLILHSNNAWCMALSYLCSELNIPCISFQEGLLRHRDQETQGKQSLAADYSSKLCVWSEGSKQAYIQSGIPESKLFVTGMAHLDSFIEKWKTADKKAFKYRFGFNPNDPLITFGMPQLSRFEGDPNVNLTQLAIWASTHLIQVAIRPHPFEGEGVINQIRNGLKQHQPIVKLVTEGETIDLLACSDLVLTQHSTVGVEAMAMGVPVAEISLTNSFILESLADQGVAFSIRSGELDNIKKILKGELVLAPEVLSNWKNINLGPLDGKSTERVVDLILGQ